MQTCYCPSVLGEEKRVTHVHSGSGRLEYDPKSAGLPSYVMQEEFSRYQGFWWQPVSPGKAPPKEGRERKLEDCELSGNRETSRYKVCSLSQGFDDSGPCMAAF